MSINKRFIDIIEHFEGGNKNAFARKCELKPTTLSGIVGARQSDPSSKILNSVILAYPNINALWLLTGKGEMLGIEKPDSTSGYLPASECHECAQKDKLIESLSDQVSSLKVQVDDLREDKQDLKDRIENLKAEKAPRNRRSA